MNKRVGKQIEEGLTEAIEINKTRKTVKQVDKEQDLTEEALVDLVKMVKFLNANRGYWAEDYMNEPHFKGCALDQLLDKYSK